MTVLGPFPDAVDERFTGEQRPVLFAFVRLAEGCLALGTVRVMELGRVHGRLRELRLYIETPLPYDLLDRVRPTGPAPEQPGLEWLGLVPADPLAALERFVAGWYALIDPAKGDPLVYYDGLGDQLLAEREPLSGFRLLFVLARVAMDGPLGGTAFADREQAQRIVAPLRPVPLRPLRWPYERTRIFACPGVVVQIGDDNEDWLEVYVGVRHRAMLLPLREQSLDWEHFTG